MLRIWLSTALVLGVAACSGNEGAKRVSADAGPLTANARNRLAERDPSSLARTAASFERAGQFSQAYELYSQALAAEPELLIAKRGQARALYYSGRTGEGLVKMRLLFEAMSDDAGVRGDYISALLRASFLDQAYAVLSDSLAAGHMVLSEYFQLAVLEEIRGENIAARQLLDQAGKKAPTDFRSQRLLALSFALSDEYRAALAILQPALGFPNSELLARQTLADVYALSGQLSIALEIAEGAYEYTVFQDRQALYGLIGNMTRQEKAMAFMLGRLSPAQAQALYSGG